MGITSHPRENGVTEREYAWSTWCTHVLEQVRDIYDMVQSHPLGKHHALDRPGLFISSPINWSKSHHVDIRLPGHAVLTISRESGQGLTLHRHLPVFDQQGRRCGGTSSFVHMEQSWSKQDPATQQCWPSAWQDAPEILECTRQALRLGTPLNASKTWDVALADYLEEQYEMAVDSAQWEHWTRQWGTPQMLADLGVVNSLFDSKTDTAAWKVQLLASWRRPQDPCLGDIPTNLFGSLSLHGAG